MESTWEDLAKGIYLQCAVYSIQCVFLRIWPFHPPHDTSTQANDHLLIRVVSNDVNQPRDITASRPNFGTWSHGAGGGAAVVEEKWHLYWQVCECVSALSRSDKTPSTLSDRFAVLKSTTLAFFQMAMDHLTPLRGSVLSGTSAVSPSSAVMKALTRHISSRSQLAAYYQTGGRSGPQERCWMRECLVSVQGVASSTMDMFLFRYFYTYRKL